MSTHASEEDRAVYDAGRREHVLALKTECLESALEKAFVEWWDAPEPRCRSTHSGPCETPGCKSGGKQTTMCALYRAHLARAAAEGV